MELTLIFTRKVRGTECV